MPVAQTTSTFDQLTLVTGWVVLLFIAAIGAVVIWKIFTGTIDISQLISEPTGNASMSRFQLLIFTFVIAASLFLIVVHLKQFPPAIPQGILVLLGISSSSYLVSKGIQFSSPDGVVDGDPMISITPQSATMAGGTQQQFAASTVKLNVETVTWTVVPNTGMGTIDATGLYKAPDAASKVTGCVEVHATSTEDATVSDIAVVHLT